MEMRAVTSDEQAIEAAQVAREAFGFPLSWFIPSRPKWGFTAHDESGEMVGGIFLKGFGAKAAMVDYIFVAKKFRGQGYGPKLMAEAQNALEHSGCNNYFAYVRDDNTPSWNLFAHHGYQRPNLLKAFFGFGFGAFLYTLLLMGSNTGYSIWSRAKESAGTSEDTPNRLWGILGALATASLVAALFLTVLGFNLAFLPHTLAFTVSYTLARLLFSWPFARSFGPVRYQMPHSGLPLTLILACFGYWWPALGQWVPSQMSWHESKFRQAKGLSAMAGWVITLGFYFLFSFLPESILDTGFAQWFQSIMGALLIYQSIPLIPFEGMDGFRVFHWNKTAYFLLLGLSVISIGLPILIPEIW